MQFSSSLRAEEKNLRFLQTNSQDIKIFRSMPHPSVASIILFAYERTGFFVLLGHFWNEMCNFPQKHCSIRRYISAASQLTHEKGVWPYSNWHQLQTHTIPVILDEYLGLSVYLALRNVAVTEPNSCHMLLWNPRLAK